MAKKQEQSKEKDTMSPEWRKLYELIGKKVGK
ncbi:hypothetical protein RKD52_000383 [Metabacillus sp. SLBN-84]